MKYALKCVVFLGIFLCACPGIAQNVRIEGRVIDLSSQEPLAYANVAYYTDISNSMKIVFTDNTGQFELEVADRSVGQLFLEISYLGYQTEKKTIEIGEEDEYHIEIEMITAQLEIDEIVITDTFPAVVIKQDTIIYNVNEFVDGTEFKLRDVLKKTPGFEVTREDEIYYLGEKVNELLVENERFFTGGTKLGVRYLPARVVSKVEVLERYNRIGPLRGTGQGDRLAVNIHLQKEQTRFVFGDALVRSDVQSRHRANTNVFYYSPLTRVNSIWDFQKSIDERTGAVDFGKMFGFSMDVLDPLSVKSDKIDLRNRITGMNPAYDQGQLFGIVHLTQKLSEDLKLNVIGTASRKDEKMESSGWRHYYEIDATEENWQKDSIHRDLSFFDMELIYDPAKKDHYVAYNLNYGHSPVRSNVGEIYQINDLTYSKILDDRTKNLSWYHDLKWIGKWNSDWSYLLNMKWEHSDTKDSDDWSAEGEKIPDFYDVPDQNIGVRHLADIHRRNGYLLAQVTRGLNRNNYLKSFYRLDGQISRGDLEDHTNFGATHQSGWESLFHSDLNYKRLYQLGALHFERRVKGYALISGLETHVAKIWAGEDNQRSRVRIRPRLKFITSWENIGRLTIQYNFRFRNPADHHYWSDLYLRNFNSIGKGNPGLGLESEGRWNMFFSLSNKRLGNNFSVGINYNRIHQPVFMQYAFQDNYFTMQPYNSEKPTQMISASLNYMRQISRWRLTSLTMWTLFDRHLSVGNHVKSLKQTTYFEQLGVTYNGRKVELDARYRISLNKIPVLDRSSSLTYSHVLEPGVKMFFTDRLSLSTEVSFRVNRSVQSRQNYLLWNGRLEYIFSDRHKVEVIGYNLMNDTLRIRDQFASQFVYSVNDRLFPRYISLQYVLTF